MPNVLKILFVIGDFVFLNFSIYLSFYLSKDNLGQPDDANRVYLFIFSNLSWLFLTMVASPYKIDKGWSVSKIVKSQFAFIFIHLITVASLIFFFKRSYSFVQIILMYAVFILIFFLWKILVYYVRNFTTPEVPFKNYIIIGKNPIALSVRRYY